MLPLHRQNRLIAVLLQFQLPGSVDHKKTAKHLPHIEQHIAVSLNIIIRIDGQILRPVRHRLNGRPVLSQVHVTGIRAEHHEIVSITDRFQS